MTQNYNKIITMPEKSFEQINLVTTKILDENVCGDDIDIFGFKYKLNQKDYDKYKEYLKKYNCPDINNIKGIKYDACDFYDICENENIIEHTCPKIFFKLTNKNENHYGYRYKDGYNFDSNEFKPFGDCSGGGLYFCDFDNLYQFANHVVQQAQFDLMLEAMEYHKNNHTYKTLDLTQTPKTNTFNHTIRDLNLRGVIVPPNIPYYEEVSNKAIKYKSPVIFLLPKINMDDIDVIKRFFNSSYGNLLFILKRIIFSANLSSNCEIINMVLQIGKNIVKKNDKKFKKIVRAICDYKHYFLMKKLFITNSKFEFKQIHNLFTGTNPDLEFITECNEKYILEDDFFHSSKWNFSNLMYKSFYYKDIKLLNYYKNTFIPKYIETNKNKFMHINPILSQINVGDGIKRIENAIQKDIPKKLLDVITKCNGYVSGSYVLKHFANLELLPKDIDIYLPHKNHGIFSEYMEGLGVLNVKKKNSYSMSMKGIRKFYKFNEKTLSDAINLAKDKHDNTNLHQQINPHNTIVELEELLMELNSNSNLNSSNLLNIDIIFVQDDNPHNFITSNFDFTFCMSSYELLAQKINLPPLSLEQVYFNTHMNKISTQQPNKKTELNLNYKMPTQICLFSKGNISPEYFYKTFYYPDSYSKYRMIKTLERIVKYTNRGFEITNINEFIAMIEKKIFI